MKAIIQSEAAECGLACLAMVAQAHGMHLGLPEMRRRFSMSLKGAKLDQLIAVAQHMGFSTRPLRAEMGALGKLKLPCILHWDLNHFVVLTRLGKGRASILDPARGERRLALTELSDHFTGVVLELTPASDFKPRTAAPAISIRQLTGPVRGIWSALAMLLGLSLALQVFVILTPLFLQWVIDQVLVSADRGLLTLLGLGFVLLLLLQSAVGVVRGWAVIHLSSRLGLQWMGNVFAHVLRLPLEYFEKRHLGDITSRMGSVQTIQNTLTNSFVEAFIDGLMVIVTLALMLVYSAKLALVTLVVVAVYAGFRLASFRAFRDASERQLVAAASQQTHLLESLRGMQSLKVAGEESRRRATYDNLMVETVNKNVWVAYLGLGFHSANQLLFGIERIVVIWIGARLALENVFSVGMLMAYLAYKDQFTSTIGGLIDKAMDFRMLRLHGERLADIVLTTPEDVYAPTQALRARDLGVEVENLSFRYADGEPWVLKGCSFSIAPGESVAITGPSGCGKTTLLKLLLGLLRPVEGTIRVGGQDLHKIGPRNLRAIAGVVMQDDQLFAGSVADNISFFDGQADHKRVEGSARLAAIHEDIMAMPMGYDSLIGDMGSSLSGGQKQRIILARALYRRPAILFLDEATSHLDTTKERLVNDAIRRVRLTKVIVAHRRETIASADRVLLMEAGRVVRNLRTQAAGGKVRFLAEPVLAAKPPIRPVR